MGVTVTCLCHITLGEELGDEASAVSPLAQLALLATQIVWTEETIRTFDDLESGSESAMKEFLTLIRNRISKLITRVRGDLNMETRIKVITIITIDVHSRDVIKKFVDQRIVEQSHFAWTSQLKFGTEKRTVMYGYLEGVVTNMMSKLFHCSYDISDE